jgi:predicted ester cyclase
MTTSTVQADTRIRRASGLAEDARLEVVRRAFEYLTVEPSKRSRTEYDAIFAPQFELFGPARENCANHSNVRPGHDLFSSFSGSELNISRMVASGDRVISYVRFAGDHTGEFEGHQPTGRRMTADGIVVHRIGDDGRITEQWSVLRWQ